jgi:hypothetical protein
MATLESHDPPFGVFDGGLFDTGTFDALSIQPVVVEISTLRLLEWALELGPWGRRERVVGLR